MRRVLVLIFLLCVLLVFPQLALAASDDDDIPGVPITATPVMGYLIAGTNNADVYSLTMRKYDRLSLRLNGDDSNASFWAEVYAPDAMSILSTTPLDDIMHWRYSYPKTCVLNASSSGLYFVAVRTLDYVSSSDAYGNYSLDWTCQSPTVTALSSRSRSIPRGGSAKVAGLVKYDVDASPIPLKMVILQKSLTGSGWVKVTSKKTDSTGHFSFTVRPTMSTYYRVVSPGTSALLKSTSSRIRIRIR